MHRTRTVTAICIGVVASIVFVACAGSVPITSPPPIASPSTSPSSSDQASDSPAPMTLRLGTADAENRPGADQIRTFAAQVKVLSAGQVLIEPVWEAHGGNDDGGWDQVVANMVMDGTIEMGNIPARAWDTLDVTSLRALDAPFLVTSDELVATVATSDLATEMLAGLESVGVTGLALAPEGLRYLFVVGDVPRSLDDLDGLLVRSPRSATTWALYDALGATGEDFTDPGESDDDAWASGRLRVAESSFVLSGFLGVETTAIGDLPLFPKMNSLVIGNGAYGRLTDDQRQVLHDAATRMVESSMRSMPDTVEAAAGFCRDGGRIVHAGDTFREEIRSAVTPVSGDLSNDPTTKSFIDRITALGTEIGAKPPEVAACG